MRSFLSIISAALLIPFISAAPPAELAKRQDTGTYCGQFLLASCLFALLIRLAFTGQWDSVNLDDYILYLDQWGKDNANSGQACASITSVSGSSVAWTTTWTWSGGSGVKSYTNINAKNNINKQLSAISSIKV